MGCSRRDAATVGLLIGSLLGPWGCTTNSHRIPPLSEQVRTEISTLGVATSSIVPTSDLKGPISGKGSGAAKGAGQAALAVVSAPKGGAGGDPRAAVVMLGLIAIAVPIAALGGAIYGAIVAPPDGKVKGAETALANAFADLKIQEAVHDHVLRAAQGCIGHRVAPLGETPDVDAILEIGVLSVRLAGAGALEINPPRHLLVFACPKLVRRADGRELYPAESIIPAFAYLSAPRKFLEWGGEDARLFREEMERAYQNLADSVVEELFMGFHPPGPQWRLGEWARRPTCPSTGAERKP
jgi:hypothetical protein